MEYYPSFLTLNVPCVIENISRLSDKCDTSLSYTKIIGRYSPVGAPWKSSSDNERSNIEKNVFLVRYARNTTATRPATWSTWQPTQKWVIWKWLSGPARCVRKCLRSYRSWNVTWTWKRTKRTSELLADYKFSNSAKFRGVIAAAAGSAATQEGVSSSGHQMSVENSINTASRPIFPTANSVVTSAIQPKDSDVTPTTSRNSWKVHGGFPLLSTQPNDNQAYLSFSPVSQFNNGTEKAEQTLLQSATFSNMSAVTADTKSGITTSTGAKELNTNSEHAKHENKECNDNSAEQSRKAILSVPQGLSPTANLANQFPPNAISPRLASDGMFPAVSSSYRPMTPLEQLALAGSSMMHNPTALVPGFPMRSSHMAMPPMSAAGMVTAHSHLPIPRLPDPSDQEDIASALQSIANQVNISK